MYNESIDSDFCLPYLARSLVRVLKTARSLEDHGLCRSMESRRKMAVCGTVVDDCKSCYELSRRLHG